MKVSVAVCPVSGLTGSAITADITCSCQMHTPTVQSSVHAGGQEENVTNS